MDDTRGGGSAEGEALAVRGACGCGRHRSLPLRVIPDTASHLRNAIGDALPPETPLMTYRCRVCKQLIVLRASDLHFVDVRSGGVAGPTRTP